MSKIALDLDGQLKAVEKICSIILVTEDSFLEHSKKTIEEYLLYLMNETNFIPTTRNEYSSLVQNVDSKIDKYINEYIKESEYSIFSFNSNNEFSVWATSFQNRFPKLPKIIQYTISSIRDACDQYRYFEKFYKIRSEESKTALTKEFQIALDNKARESEKVVNLQVQTLKNELVSSVNCTKGSLEKKVRNFKRKINNIQHEMLTHIITLLGAFVAVVVIVMSIVITSSARLNNASNASAIVAFVVPNLVTTLVVICLVSLVFSFIPGQISMSDDTLTDKAIASPNGVQSTGNSTDDLNKQMEAPTQASNGAPELTTTRKKLRKDKSKSKSRRSLKRITFPRVVFVASVATTIILCVTSYPTISERLKVEQIIHERYILSPQDYSLINEDGERMIKFKLNGFIHKISVDDSFDTHSTICFCEKCGKLE